MKVESSVKLIENRIAFSDFDSFANFSKLSSESRNIQLAELTGLGTEEFQKRNLGTSIKNEYEFVIHSDLIRSIINDDYMYQIGETVYKETYDYQFITHIENIDLLYDNELLNDRVSEIGKEKNSDHVDVYSTETWSTTDLIVFPIQRTFNNEPQEPCPPNTLCDGDTGSGGPGGDSGSGQTIRDVSTSNTTENELFVKYHDNDTYRANFRAITEIRNQIASFYCYVKHEKRQRVLGIPVGWQMNTTDFISITGGSVQVTFENYFNNTLVTRADNFLGNSGASVADLYTESADIPFSSYERIYSINGHSDQIVYKTTGNLNYQVGRRVVFK